jgi:hypothetical protein
VVVRSNDRQAWSGGSGTWVRTYDVWILRERHDMMRMLLAGRTICICSPGRKYVVKMGHSQLGLIDGASVF